MGCPNELFLIRFLIEGKDQAVAEHLAGCQHCRDFAASYRSENAAFLEANPFSPALLHKKPTPRFSLTDWLNTAVRTLLRPVVLAPLTALLVLTFAPTVEQRDPAAYRLKGAPLQFGYYLKHKGMYTLPTTAALGKGDEIKLYYQAPLPYLLIAGIDRRGTITIYYADEDRSLRVEPGQMTMFDSKITLDDSPDELLLGFFTKEPLTRSDVEDQLRSQAGKPLEELAASFDSSSVGTILLRKR